MKPISSDSGRYARFRIARAVRKFLGSMGVATVLMIPLARAVLAQVPIVPLQLSTNPGNGDQNPYGIVFVPVGFPNITVQPGDVLVSNFNDKANNQGQGTTIINIRPDRTFALFAGTLTKGPTAALGILRAGFVLTGSITVPIPSNFLGSKSGPITVLDSNGKLVTTIAPKSTLNPTSLLNGPWEMAVADHFSTAEVYVSNVLDGTIIRINVQITFNPTTFHVVSITRVAMGFGHVLSNLTGLSGLAFDPETHTLYFSSQVTNNVGAIFSLANADKLTSPGAAKLIYFDKVHLHGPLGLVLAPNGDLLSAQADSTNVDPNQPSEIVEFTKTGHFVAQYSVDHTAGGAFNVAIGQNPADLLSPIEFAYVNDNAGSLTQLFLPPAWSLAGLSVRPR
jgi:hypothetical protein